MTPALTKEDDTPYNDNQRKHNIFTKLFVLTTTNVEYPQINGVSAANDDNDNTQLIISYSRFSSSPEPLIMFTSRPGVS